MAENKTSSLPYCLVPWVHVHAFSGKRKLCCVAQVSEDAQMTMADPLRDYWNSDYLKSVRLKMLEHNPPKECHACFDDQSSLIDTKEFYLLEYKAQWDELLTHTKSDGEFSLSPQDVDYRLDNTCNFTCRMCNSYTSSSIERLESKAGLKIKEDEFLKIVSSELVEEVCELIRAGAIKGLYFADGEPFLSSYHWKIIHTIVEYQMQANISLRYNSNLSIFHYQGRPLTQWLSGFKSIHINASMDGYGETSEFIRSPFKWNIWLKNFRLWKEFVGENLVVAVTLTLPTLLDLERLVVFLKEERVSWRMNICTANGVESLWSPLALDAVTLRKILFEYEQNEILMSFDQVKIMLRKILDMPLRSQELNWFANLVGYLNYYHRIDQFRDGISSIDWIFSQKRLERWYNLILKELFSDIPKEIQCLISRDEKIACFSPYTISLKFRFYPIGKYNADLYVIDNCYVDLEFFASENFQFSCHAKELYLIGPSSSFFNRLIGGKRIRQQKIFENFILEKLNKDSFDYVLFEKRALPFNVENILPREGYIFSILKIILTFASSALPRLFHTQELKKWKLIKKTEMGDKPDPVVDYHSSRP